MLARGSDVAFVDGETLRELRTVRGGARDLWHFILWDGFRPTQALPAEQVAVQPADDTTDTTAANAFEGASVNEDTAASSAVDGATERPADTGRAPAFPIQFAALRGAGAAREPDASS